VTRKATASIGDARPCACGGGEVNRESARREKKAKIQRWRRRLTSLPRPLRRPPPAAPSFQFQQIILLYIPLHAAADQSSSLLCFMLSLCASRSAPISPVANITLCVRVEAMALALGTAWLPAICILLHTIIFLSLSPLLVVFVFPFQTLVPSAFQFSVSDPRLPPLPAFWSPLLDRGKRMHDGA
jgi:hypothetical protein